MKLKCFFILSVILITNVLFAENMYFFGKTSVTNAQFWEKQTAKSSDLENRKVLSNTTGFTMGVGMEWVIWDLGVKRGSRIYLSQEISFIGLALNYMGETADQITYSTIKDIDINDGAMYSGVSYGIFFGGTFPKTDLKWGFGSDFNFTFPTYSSKKLVNSDLFAFYATPSILIGYDFLIPHTTIKINPYLKTGITTVPLIPQGFLPNADSYKTTPENWYSGLYIDLGLSISFATVEWKK